MSRKNHTPEFKARVALEALKEWIAPELYWTPSKPYIQGRKECPL